MLSRLQTGSRRCVQRYHAARHRCSRWCVRHGLASLVVLGDALPDPVRAARLRSLLHEFEHAYVRVLVPCAAQRPLLRSLLCHGTLPTISSATRFVACPFGCRLADAFGLRGCFSLFGLLFDLVQVVELVCQCRHGEQCEDGAKNNMFHVRPLSFSWVLDRSHSAECVFHWRSSSPSGKFRQL